MINPLPDSLSDVSESNRYRALWRLCYVKDKIMIWELIKVDDVEWQQDKSGFYTLINVLPSGEIRLDIMTSTDSPAISFQGEAANVRKAAMKYAEQQGWSMSLEHAAYIGYEIARAEVLLDSYVQD